MPIFQMVEDLLHRYRDAPMLVDDEPASPSGSSLRESRIPVLTAAPVGFPASSPRRYAGRAEGPVWPGFARELMGHGRNERPKRLSGRRRLSGL